MGLASLAVGAVGLAAGIRYSNVADTNSSAQPQDLRLPPKKPINPERFDNKYADLLSNGAKCGPAMIPSVDELLTQRGTDTKAGTCASMKCFNEFLDQYGFELIKPGRLEAEAILVVDHVHFGQGLRPNEPFGIVEKQRLKWSGA